MKSVTWLEPENPRKGSRDSGALKHCAMSSLHDDHGYVHAIKERVPGLPLLKRASEKKKNVCKV
jgi:hypothetical protein